MTKRLPLLAAVLAVALLGGCGSSSSSSSSSSGSSASASTSSASASSSSSGSAQLGFEGVAVESGAAVAPAGTTGTRPADGISCGPTEQLLYHIHAHLAVYVNGQSRAVPGGIGIPGSTVQQTAQGPVAAGGACIYWLHTHAPDGVIHVESPTRRIYTLGNFFDEWHQPLSSDRVGQASGHVTAYVNGKVWRQSPRSIPLTPHAVIQLDVGTPLVPPRSLSWSGLNL